MRRLGADQDCSTQTATRCRTARPASCTRATPYTFDGYWKLPEKTAEAFRGDYCSVGDMARRDEDGYIHLVDRKSNMIISGGENIYPSEVEAVLGAHPAVKDVAVVGLPDDKWGERVHAVIVAARRRHARAKPSCSTGAGAARRLQAAARRARSSREGEMPRTATGKILHRVLRDTTDDRKEGAEPVSTP